MKEFEKYLETNYPSVRPTSDNAEFARQIWKAALEWVLNNKRWCRECDYNIDVDIIKKELKE